MVEKSLAVLGLAVAALAALATAECGGAPASARPDAEVDVAASDARPDATDGGPTLMLGEASTSDPFGPGDASSASRVGALFATVTCSGGPETPCHQSGAGHLHLSLATHGGDVVGVRSYERPSMLRVKPYSLSDSYLFLKVAGDGGIDGSHMPPGPFFDDRIVRLVGEWIEGGAPLP